MGDGEVVFKQEEADVANAIKRIDSELDGLEHRSEEVAIGALRGGPLGSGALHTPAMEQRDARHSDLLKEREQLVLKLKALLARQ